MIAIASAWFSGRNASGTISCISRPSRYSGNCGPGTLVTIRLKSLVEKLRREAWASSVGGAKSCSPAITSAPSACFDSLSSPIPCCTTRRRSTGSSTYTGRGPRIAAIRLPSAPRSSSLRIDTGTSARSSVPWVRTPRSRSQRPSEPATTARTASFTVPPSAFLISLKSASRLCTQRTRRCGPIGTLSGTSGAGFRPAHTTSPIPSAASRTCSIVWPGRWSAPSARPSSVRPNRHVERHVGRRVQARPHHLADPLCGLTDLLDRVARALERTERTPGEAEGGTDQPLHAVKHELGVGGLGSRSPELLRLRLGRHGRQVEEDGCNVHAGNAVHERVVRLRDQREAAALQALHDPGLPERLRAVEPLGEDPPQELAQLVVAAGLGQSGVAHVIVEVETRVVHPERPTGVERRERQLLAVARHQPQACLEMGAELLARRWRPLKDRQRPHVHVRGLLLLVEE